MRRDCSLVGVVVSEDPALKAFDDLDYPGKRKPVNRDRVAPPEEPLVWDAKPIYYFVHGERREFFQISALARALGCSVQSIRAWEATGLMPITPFRSPRAKGMMAGGRSNKGRRLWTREQVEIILREAKHHGVILPNRRGLKHPPTPAFAKDVARQFNELVDNTT